MNSRARVFLILLSPVSQLLNMKHLTPQVAKQATYQLMQDLFLHPESHSVATRPLHLFLYWNRLTMWLFVSNHKTRLSQSVREY